MKISVGLYQCRCGYSFKAPLLSEFSYGEFLMWSRSGSVAYLNALEDPCYTEVRSLVAKALPRVRDDDLIKTLKGVFGQVSCDPDENGSAFQLADGPFCASDGSAPEGWLLLNPPEFQEVRPVTHRVWNALTPSEKRRRLDQALNG